VAVVCEKAAVGRWVLERFYKCRKLLQEKHKVPHSYSRAEENARFVDGIRDDEFEKDYANTKTALALGLVFQQHGVFPDLKFTCCSLNKSVQPRAAVLHEHL
jgi:hypothetical protein